MRLILGVIAQTSSLVEGNKITLKDFLKSAQSVSGTSTNVHFLVLDPINRSKRMRMNYSSLIIVFSRKRIKS